MRRSRLPRRQDPSSAGRSRCLIASRWSTPSRQKMQASRSTGLPRPQAKVGDFDGWVRRWDIHRAGDIKLPGARNVAVCRPCGRFHRRIRVVLYLKMCRQIRTCGSAHVRTSLFSCFQTKAFGQVRTHHKCHWHPNALCEKPSKVAHSLRHQFLRSVMSEAKSETGLAPALGSEGACSRSNSRACPCPARA